MPSTTVNLCFVCLFTRVTVPRLLAHEFFNEEGPSPVVKYNTSKKENGELSFHMELRDFETQDRTLLDFSFNLDKDVPEDVAKDMVRAL